MSADLNSVALAAGNFPKYGFIAALRDFCGEISIVFANTTSMESDFSILGWEKDEYRLSLTDLVLKGIIQCK